MKLLKAKNAYIGRVITYLLFLLVSAAPFIIKSFIHGLSDVYWIPIFVAWYVLLIFFIVKNLVEVLFIGFMLAAMNCDSKARTVFFIPKKQTVEKIEKSVSQFGFKKEPVSTEIKPTMLRYKLSNPLTEYTSGIEKIVVTYHIDYLDNNSFNALISSAKKNSKALKGSQKATIIKKAQKDSPLNRVTVVIIFTKNIESSLSEELYDMVCNQDIKEDTDSVVPCVIDTSNNTCIFNCWRDPYVFLEYPVKNRGINLVKKIVFGGKLPLKNNTHYLERDYDPEDCIWSIIKNVFKKDFLSKKNIKKQFQKMNDNEFFVYEDRLCLKLEEHGVVLMIHSDSADKKMTVQNPELWDYPKRNNIKKSSIELIKSNVKKYYNDLGYEVSFIDLADFDFNED